MRFIGLDACPYCKSGDVTIQEHRPEIDDKAGGDTPNDIVCQDFSCERCGKMWTVSYSPVAFYVYDGDDFIDDPKPFDRVG